MQTDEQAIRGLVDSGSRRHCAAICPHSQLMSDDVVFMCLAVNPRKQEFAASSSR